MLLGRAHQIGEKGWSKEAYVQLCGRNDCGYFTAEFLTSETLPYTVALWNKTTNISDEMMSALLDGDVKASIYTKTIFNESDTEMPVHGEIPGGGIAVKRTARFSKYSRQSKRRRRPTGRTES